ncbi:ribonuclease H-like domain-containing protein [Tanacetum coccineum]
MTGNLTLLSNFVERYLGTVHFGNYQFALILGYGDLVQGNIMINRVYYIKGLNHNLFSIGQFCDADLEVASQKSTCFVRDLQGNDLLTGNRGSDLYIISLQETTLSTPLCLMAKASPTQAWLWHRRLSHLNFDYINLLSKKDFVIGLPKLKYVKDQLCSSCEVSKAKRSSFKTKDETPEVLKDFLMMIQRNLQALVISVRTDRGTEFLNKTLNTFFKEEGIEHQTSTPQTPEQNDVVERRNRTLVEAAQTMLSASKLPLFFWAKAIATACYTLNRSIIIPTHEKTAYHIINDRKPLIKHCWELCFPNLVPLDTQGQIKVLPPRTTKEILARERERKARTTLLMALPEDHLAKFHKMTDAKEMWEAIKSRFSGNDESKKMQKYILKKQFEGFSVSNLEGLHKGYDRFQSLLSQLEIHGAGVSTEDANQKFLRSLPSAWSQVSLVMRTKPGVESLSIDDLYNNLRVFESDIKGSTASSSSTQNVAFVSENTSSTNNVSTAYGVSNSSDLNSSYEQTSSYSLLANQSSCPQLDHEDLEQIDEFDLEEIDLKWQVAMISMRMKKFYKKTGRELQFDAKEPVGFDKTKVEYLIATRPGILLGNAEIKELKMAREEILRTLEIKIGEELVNRRTPKHCSSSNTEVNSCTNECKESYAKLKKLYDEQRKQLSDASIEIQAYTQGLKKVEAQLVAHQQGQLWYEQKIKFMKIDLDDKTDMSAYDKFGLGYGDHRYDGILSCENEVLQSVFKSKEIWSDAPIIEEYESDSDDDCVSLPTIEQDQPSFANTNLQVKTPKETIKNQDTHSKVDKKGMGYGFTTKACFVCGSLSHLIRDCDFHEKQMAKQAELNNRLSKNSSQNEIRPIWNNVQRINHQNKFVPTAVLNRTGKIPVNTARHTARASSTNNVSTARHNLTRQAVPSRKVNTIKPMGSTFAKPLNRTTTLRSNSSNQKVYTAGLNVVSVIGGKRETAVKPSAGCNWRPKGHIWNKVYKYNGGSRPRNYATFKDPLGRLKPKQAWVPKRI